VFNPAGSVHIPSIRDHEADGSSPRELSLHDRYELVRYGRTNRAGETLMPPRQPKPPGRSRRNRASRSWSSLPSSPTTRGGRESLACFRESPGTRHPRRVRSSGRTPIGPNKLEGYINDCQIVGPALLFVVRDNHFNECVFEAAEVFIAA